MDKSDPPQVDSTKLLPCDGKCVVPCLPCRTARQKLEAKTGPVASPEAAPIEPIESSGEWTDEIEVALGPPRFSFGALTAGLTVLGALCGLMMAAGGMWALVILLFAGLVMCHVLGNSLGTRLRDRASQRAAVLRLWETHPAPVLDLEKAAPRRLRERARLKRITLVMAIGGTISGGVLGGMLSAFIYPEAGAAAVGLGVVSAAVLGAYLGFAASSFLSVGLAALGEAHRDPGGHPFSHHPWQ